MFDFLVEKGLSLSIVVGTLLVPLAAVAAVWLSTPEQEPAEADDPSTPPKTEAVVTATSPDLVSDVRNACGPEGMELVSLEDTGAITDVQQAALDGLREVCQQQGVPLSPPPSAEPVTPAAAPAVEVAAPVTMATIPANGPDTHFEDGQYEVEYEDGEIEVEYESEDDGYEYEYEVDD